jgi:lysophospholipase L1-like esterase
VVVALGDSITSGVGDAVGPDSPYGPGWAAHLASLVGTTAFTNLARDGSRARTVVDEQLDGALGLAPDLATLVVGGNDALRSDYRPDEVARQLDLAVGALHARGTAVVLATLPAIGLFELFPGRVRRVMRDRIDALNSVVRGCAARTSDTGRTVLFDVGGALQTLGVGIWHVDRVHPSPAGHRHIAAGACLRLAGGDLRAHLERLSPPPAPPSPLARTAWLAVAGLPWTVRRGRDFVPGLVRAVVDDLRRPATAPALLPTPTTTTAPAPAVGMKSATSDRFDPTDFIPTARERGPEEAFIPGT